MKRFLRPMKRPTQVLAAVVKTLPRVMCWGLLLVLPVGYYPDDADSTEFVLGVHGGRGQIASVIRGCNGEALHSEVSDFSDFSAEAYLPLSKGEDATVVAGMRLGHFQTDWGVASSSYYNGRRSYFRSEDRLIDFWYINPNLSIETEKVGFGFGMIVGDKNKSVFGAASKLSGPQRPVVSLHLRFGRLDRSYFLLSYAENTPLVSAGGLFDIGIGYRVGKSADLFTGLAGGMYDRVGVVQQGRFRLGGPVHLDLSLRLGSAGDVSENSFATGLTFMLGKRSAAKSEFKKKKRGRRGQSND